MVGLDEDEDEDVASARRGGSNLTGSRCRRLREDMTTPQVDQES